MEFDEESGVEGVEYRSAAELVLGGGCKFTLSWIGADTDADVECNFNFDDEKVGGEGAK